MMILLDQRNMRIRIIIVINYHNSNQLSSVTEGKEEPEIKKKLNYQTEDQQKT